MKSTNKSIYPPTIAQLLDFLTARFSVIVFDDAMISQPYKIIKVVLIAYFSVNP